MKIKRRDKRTKLDRQIDRLLEEIDLMEVKVVEDENRKGSVHLDPEYAAKLDVLERLNKLRGEKTAKKGVSPDTIAIVAGNLLGIVLILNYEKIGVVTSKALGFVIRGRV